MRLQAEAAPKAGLFGGLFGAQPQEPVEDMIAEAEEEEEEEEVVETSEDTDAKMQGVLSGLFGAKTQEVCSPTP